MAADFPPLALNKENQIDVIGEDSSKFSYEYEDKTIKSDTESGYVFTRKRHTRAPRRVFKTGFTDLIDEQKQAIDDFVKEYNIGAQMFVYEDPTTSEEITVRFTKTPKFKYKGMEGRHLWDVDDVEMREV